MKFIPCALPVVAGEGLLESCRLSTLLRRSRVFAANWCHDVEEVDLRDVLIAAESISAIG